MILVQASATALPHDDPLDAPFHVCVSSLAFHHLEPRQKRAALGEAFRVLAPGGRLVIADWGPPQTAGGRLAFAVTQVFDGVATTRDHATGDFEAMLRALGLVDFAKQGRWATPVGTLCLYHGTKPAPSGA